MPVLDLFRPRSSISPPPGVCSHAFRHHAPIHPFSSPPDFSSSLLAPFAQLTLESCRPQFRLNVVLLTHVRMRCTSMSRRVYSTYMHYARCSNDRPFLCSVLSELRSEEVPVIALPSAVRIATDRSTGSRNPMRTSGH